MFHRATGIGSLPHHSSHEAIKLIRENLVHIPHWPQLPRRDSQEGFVLQYLMPMINAGLIAFKENKNPFFCSNERDWDDRVLRYYEMLMESEEKGYNVENSPFAFPAESAEGFFRFLEERWDLSSIEIIKGQITGPVATGLQVTDPRGSPAFYNDELRELIVKTLTSQAKWQLNQLGRLGKPVMLFIDDPSIYGFGTSSYVGLGREPIQSSLAEVARGIKDGGGLTGVHCCAGVDWSLLFELPFDLVNFDAYEYFSSILVYIETLAAFLERGGGLAWGIIPTSDKIDGEDVSSLFENLFQKVDDLVSRGIKREKLEKQLVLTPSCGAATLSEERAGKVYKLLAQLEQKVSHEL